MIVQAGVDFTLLEPAELIQPIRDVSARLLRGTASAGRHVTQSTG